MFLAINKYGKPYIKVTAVRKSPVSTLHRNLAFIKVSTAREHTADHRPVFTGPHEILRNVYRSMILLHRNYGPFIILVLF